MKRVFTYSGITRDATVRDYLRSLHYSAGCMTFLKKHAGISIDGQPVRAVDVIHPGQILTVVFDEYEENPDIAYSCVMPEIIYEDEDILIINKPPHLPVHPSRGYHGDTLANQLAGYYHRQGESFICRVLTRLDNDTSGLVLVAKNMYASAVLAESQLDHRFHKEYLAIAEGLFEQTEGMIDKPIIRPSPDSIIRTVSYDGGQNALTRYEVMKQNKGHALLKVIPETGRTHQIRVHLASIGHPLIGDTLYNPANSKMRRQALHAFRLSFPHPVTGETMSFEVPLPDDMQEAIDRYL